MADCTVAALLASVALVMCMIMAVVMVMAVICFSGCPLENNIAACDCNCNCVTQEENAGVDQHQAADHTVVIQQYRAHALFGPLRTILHYYV